MADICDYCGDVVDPSGVYAHTRMERHEGVSINMDACDKCGKLLYERSEAEHDARKRQAWAEIVSRARAAGREPPAMPKSLLLPVMDATD